MTSDIDFDYLPANYTGSYPLEFVQGWPSTLIAWRRRLRDQEGVTITHQIDPKADNASAYTGHKG